MNRLKLMVIAAALAATTPVLAAPFNHVPEQRHVAQRLEAGDTKNLAAEAFDAMFSVAGTLLRDRGHGDDADQLAAEWAGTYRARFTAIQDAGDHKPVSEWIEGWYAKLYAVLGDRIMEMSHLKDIFVLNYTIPVVFSRSAASQWCLEDLQTHPEDTCKREYARHFVGTKYPRTVDPDANIVTHHGFSGVVTYWAIWTACEVATYGSGWFLVCSPAGDLGEIGIEKWVAPRASDSLYDSANP